MIHDNLPKKDEGFLGMYELQFWLGLRALAPELSAAQPLASVSTKYWQRFQSNLPNSDAPGALAARHKSETLAWLARCEAENWAIVA